MFIALNIPFCRLGTRSNISYYDSAQRTWGSGYGAALLVRRSRDRSPVVSLGIFSEASDKSMCPGSTQPLKMSTRIFLGVKAACAWGVTTLPPSCAECHEIWEP